MNDPKRRIAETADGSFGLEVAKDLGKRALNPRRPSGGGSRAIAGGCSATRQKACADPPASNWRRMGKRSQKGGRGPSHIRVEMSARGVVKCPQLRIT